MVHVQPSWTQRPAHSSELASASDRVLPFRAGDEKNAPVKHRFALVGGTIYPAPFERPITNGVVLIENGKIIEVDEKQSCKFHLAQRRSIAPAAPSWLASGYEGQAETKGLEPES
jgi:hypothetical protein